MNREIMFRGKRIDNSEWVYGVPVVRFDGLVSMVDYCGGNPVHAETVGQYLELFDDNGDEIYQGDIVKVHHKGETYTPYVSEVYFEPHCGAMVKSHPSHIEMGHDQFRHLSGYCDYGVGGNPEVCCEIIGNIHDNPEMLEVS
jgi:uncharacterized phage protein (TIGR01671 family)